MYFAKNRWSEISMKSVSILLNTTESVKKFVNIMSAYDYPTELRSGRYVVDAKSILGIFSLYLNRPVVLEIGSDDCDDLLKDIAPFIYD